MIIQLTFFFGHIPYSRETVGRERYKEMCVCERRQKNEHSKSCVADRF
jgi:hypothetical protein